MVATQFARGRAVTAAIAFIMLSTLVPTPASAQVGTITDIAIVQGEAQIFQSTFHNGADATQFINGGSRQISVIVPVYSTTAVTDVGVYAIIQDVEGSQHNDCQTVDLPARGQDDNHTNVQLDLTTNDLAPGGYKVSLSALTVPDGMSACPGATPACGTPSATQIAQRCVREPAVNALPNAATGFFVKDQYIDLQIEEILWCAGPEATDDEESATPDTDLHPDCDPTMVDGTYNVTEQTPKGETLPHPTFFEVRARNAGNWTDPLNYGGAYDVTDAAATPPTWGIGAEIKITGPFFPLAYANASGGVAGDLFVLRSESWDIVDHAGVYNVTVNVDKLESLRRAPDDTSSNVGQRDAHVKYRDFTGNITLDGPGSTAIDPYPYTSSFEITGAFTLRNDGTADAREDAGGVKLKTKYTVYIDNLTSSIFNFTKDNGPTDAGGSIVVPYTFAVSSTGTSTKYIPPGRHTIVLAADPSEETLELNESNNNISAQFFIADATKPKFNNTPKITPAGINGAAQSTYFPKDAFNVFVNVTDDDAALTVKVNFTLDSDPTVTREYNASDFGVESYHVVRIEDFDFHNMSAIGDLTDGALRTENWTVRVDANDSSHNSVSSETQKLKLQPWPVHRASADYIVVVPSDFPGEANVSYATGPDPRWVIRVEPNMTGYVGQRAGSGPVNQQNHTHNLALNVTTAKGITLNENGTYWTANTRAVCLTPENRGNEIIPIGQPTCTAADAETNNTFETSVNMSDPNTGPGRWNYSIRITDVAGHTRVINGTVLVQDFAPSVWEFNKSADTVLPGGNFTLGVNVTDDEKSVVPEVHVNFTRTTGSDKAYVNLTLEDKTDVPCRDNRICYNFNQTFKVGRGEFFGIGGTFDVTLAVTDPVGNWNVSKQGTFNVTDEDPPKIDGYGTVPATAAQIGENVTFWAKASDATNVTVKLDVFRTGTSSELLFDPIMLEEAPDGNFTTTLQFDAEGVHAWRLTAVDSLGHPSSLSEGALTVRDNLGPRFDVRSPSVVLDGTRYGSGTPRIEIAVFDVEGVDPTSIDMKVAGLPVDYTLVPAPGNLNGYLLSYEVKANKKFSHLDVVDVNLTAKDNSSDALASALDFSFTVDDVAPIARISAIVPSYRDQPGHVLNVSLNSRITLAADDNDGLPTDVESIRYRILGSGPSSAETVYTAPFHMNDAPGVYTGPRLYQIQFWAEDAVGNLNRAFNTTTVYVDDTPPALFQFFPQGRAVNATFVDDRVGVNKSVVWYRENTEPYVPLPLVETDGAWTLTLPEGVKGDVVSYYLQAWDRLDNTETFGNATHPYATFNVSNHEPKVKITAPVDGGRIFRTVDLTWDASDEDGDALVFTIFYKAPGKTNFVELAKIENSATRRYTLDSTRFPDGQYTFRLAAGDGGFVKLAETTVTILNRASAVGVVNVLGDSVPGGTMLVKAEITKAEAVVEARVYLDGKLVDSYPMNDQGKEGDEVANDGFFSVRVPVDAAGDYSVEIFTQYREDGELKESSLSNAATFNAKLTPGYIMGTYGAVIALIGLLAAVGIGVGVFVVVRRR
ncbi:MAG TPA: choice-of-anchor X domain-containing protein [Candidatus Thermoplasmatota archaeon]|nr:choice-of-anchor X domain-containing protein [Candidatus Thermoplasmatota archaeon]